MIFRYLYQMKPLCPFSLVNVSVAAAESGARICMVTLLFFLLESLVASETMVVSASWEQKNSGCFVSLPRLLLSTE